jgi:glycosyltransferase involved in cell wall biosynthesis
MRFLVHPHELSVGGSQLNAVELAAAVRDRGHEVAVFGVPGPLAARIHDLGLELIAAPDDGRRPSPAAARRLAEVVRAERIDLVHGYEWPPILADWAGARFARGVPVVGTILSMGIAPFLPVGLPLIVGTRQLGQQAGARHPTVHVVEPPVDTDGDHPGVDASAFRASFGLDDRLTVAVVSRLAVDLKLEGLERAIAAVATLAGELPVRLVIAGDGEARGRLEALAAEVNADRPGTVVLTGQLMDPRPAYAAADVVLGMGGSVLRGLAFAKPAIVLGEDGFSEILDAGTAERFLWHGFYGLGDGDRTADRLAGQLRTLLGDQERRAALGRFSREFVVERFSLTSLGRSLEGIYQAALGVRPSRPRTLVDGAVAAIGLTRYKLARRRARRAGGLALDDFNARPVITAPPSPEQVRSER